MTGSNFESVSVIPREMVNCRGLEGTEVLCLLSDGVSKCEIASISRVLPAGGPSKCGNMDSYQSSVSKKWYQYCSPETRLNNMWRGDAPAPKIEFEHNIITRVELRMAVNRHHGKWFYHHSNYGHRDRECAPIWDWEGRQPSPDDVISIQITSAIRRELR